MFSCDTVPYLITKKFLLVVIQKKRLQSPNPKPNKNKNIKLKNIKLLKNKLSIIIESLEIISIFVSWNTKKQKKSLLVHGEV